ncbi:3-hydroxyacyl-[acyl-carrier-protein] dehydratase FabZ [Erysipelotrichaceae bacterium]|nr:3-hydroxyacyl-[acyl-carrier-protein] dehydratase FabZ [Erysipelotrichaceae bacterium]
MAVVYNSEQIKKIIPHRYPFLLVDRIDEVGETAEGKGYMVGRKNVTTNEPFFQGHFPKYQVMPGVLIVEALAQVGAIAMLAQPENAGKLVFFTGIDKTKFRKQVVPGDVLTLYVETIRTKKFQGKVFGSAKAKATVGGVIAAEGEISFVVAENEQE